MERDTGLGPDTSQPLGDMTLGRRGGRQSRESGNLPGAEDWTDQGQVLSPGFPW